ncbi:MAG TPA: hypothetical protein VFC84_20415 [Desulfosporosinus sp.]|nr:hypothetical protein [Desulfosporosinus sp.]
MLKSILNIILGVSEVIAIIVFTVAYGIACTFVSWIPDLSSNEWALITGSFSLIVLALSFGLWRFTSYKESIHGWILLPGIIVGKVWITTSDNRSFNTLLIGSILVSVLFVFLILVEVIRTYSVTKVPTPENVLLKAEKA